MDKDYAEVNLTFEKGVNKFIEASALPSGYAADIENWVPESYGALRTRIGWDATPATSGVRPNRGIFVWDNNTYIAGKNVSSNNCVILSHDEGAPLSGSWTVVETVNKALGDSLVAFANGNGKLWYTHHNFDEIRSWDGATAAAVAGSPPGQCLTAHKGRLWSGGTDAQDTRLWFSEVGDFTEWPADNYFKVGEGDGEPIYDVVSWAGQLLIAKQSSLWILSGAGIDTFRLDRIPGTIGGSPGRCLVPSPYGVFVVGLHNLYVTDGQSADLVSQPLGAAYTINGDWVTGAYAYETVYICDPGESVWALRPRTGAWWRETINSSGSDLNTLVAHLNHLWGGTVDGDATPALFRHVGTGARDQDFATTGISTSAFTATTADVWANGAHTRMTPRYLFLALRQRGGTDDETGLTVDVYYDGDHSAPYDTKVFGPEIQAGVTRYRWDLGHKQGISAVGFRFTQEPMLGEEALFDIEQATLGYYVEDIR